MAEEKDPNYLELSDEDFDKLPEPAEPVEEESSNEEVKPDIIEDTTTEEETDKDEEHEDESSSDTDDSSNEQEHDDVSDDDKSEEKSDVDPDTKEKKDEVKDTESNEIDYKANYEAALAPLPANGTTIQLDSIEQLRKLASAGMNYTKKMVALKPNLKLMKMLENNGLLDEGKLSYLIDLDKKNPDAIKKLMIDGNVDPLEVNLDDNTEYKPNTYTVDDKQLLVDQVLDDIRGTPSYDETIDIIGNKWDESSKEILLNKPEIITALNDHVASGIFKTINDEVEAERMLGNLTGLSDLDAYKQIGDAIQARGGFNTEPPAPELKLTPTKKVTDDPKLKDKKRAASPTKSGKSNVAPKDDYNPLALSDEDFEKATANSFL